MSKYDLDKRVKKLEHKECCYKEKIKDLEERIKKLEKEEE